MPELKTCAVLTDIAKQIRCGKPARWNDGKSWVCDDCMDDLVLMKPKHAGSQPKDSLQLRDWLAGMAIAGILQEGLPGNWNIRAEWAYYVADAMLKARVK